MDPHAYTFRPTDLVGGHVVLDLTNTVTGRDAVPTDWIDSYGRVLEWARLTGHFDDSTLAALDELSAADPDEAATALQRLCELREAVFWLLTAMVRSEEPPEESLARLESQWKEAVALARVTVVDKRTRMELDVRTSRLDYLRHELALRAFELLQTYPVDRTRICAGSRCSWLFIDRSRGGQRRWCDMATCGNAAKSRRHYERKRRERT